MSSNILPMFSSKSCIVSGLTFRSLIYFEFIFVYGVRKCSNCILLHVAVQFSSTIYWRGCLCPTVYSCLLCQKQGVHRCMDLSLGFLFCSIDLYFCLCASTIMSWWLWLCSKAWSQAGWFFQFHSSFSRLLWLFKVFSISIQIVKLFVLALWKILLVAW